VTSGLPLDPEAVDRADGDQGDDAPRRAASGPPRLDVLKALGDNTRYAIYLELARSPLPLTTAEVAEALGLHVNTVRPHLERMREVGLLHVEAEARGSVGRPVHRYSLAADAPSLGLEPSPFPTLARVLLAAAAAAGVDGDEVAEAGREQGRADAEAWTAEGTGGDAAIDCLDALLLEQTRLGFDPALVTDEAEASLAFAHCPFRTLAEAHPDLVCSLHRGLVEGLVGCFAGASVVRFHPLVDRTPCQVEVRLA
jgi:predicted ArsR family transcriptional regulator